MDRCWEGSTILAIDPSTRTVTRDFGGRPDQRMFSKERGTVQRLANGNLLITEAAAGRVIEVDSKGDVVWEFINRFDDSSVAIVTHAQRYNPGLLHGSGLGMSVAPFLRVFHDYVRKADIQAEVTGAFFSGIELLAGRACREHCETGGLPQMHRYFPADHVHLLEAYVNHRIKRRMLEWSAAVGRTDLGFQDDFLVEDLLVVRVHYPHAHIGRASGPAERPRLPHRLRYGFSAALERMRDAYDSKDSLRLASRMWEYTRQRRKRAALPLPYRCHAPHLDSWLGQPMTSLSVWLAIAGVDRDNSMCLYPDTFGARLPFNGSQFLGSGFCLPKPMRPDISDGDLFVFSTDILHSSQVNVSDMTRIALTTRIDPGTPTFSQDSLWFVQRWYSAAAIERGRWQHTVVRASEHSVPRPADAATLPRSRCISIPAPLRPNEPHEDRPLEHDSGQRHARRAVREPANPDHPVEGRAHARCRQSARTKATGSTRAITTTASSPAPDMGWSST